MNAFFLGFSSLADPGILEYPNPGVRTVSFGVQGRFSGAQILAYNVVVVGGGRLLDLLERTAVGEFHGPVLTAVGTIFQGMPADRDLVARLYAVHFPALSSDHADGTHFKRPLHVTASSGIDRDDVQPGMWITPFEFLQHARDGNHLFFVEHRGGMMRLSLNQENAQHDSRKSDDFHEVPPGELVIP